MYCTRSITNDLYWLGASDRRLALFENAYPIPRGISYNAYLLLDEKTVLLDTVDLSVGELFFENLDHLLQDRKLDYVVVNHVEPDHCATLGALLRRHPETQVVGNAKTLTMIGQFFSSSMAENALVVKEGDVLSTGRHELTFVMAPMVHWPETMATYDKTDKVLFSADAFGTFGAMSGNLFADEMDFEKDWLDDARRYYTNIVGKYGPQVQNLLKKAAGLDIQYLCPLHGPIWRKDAAWFIEKYQRWSTYTPEERGVVIAYASVYGGTENAANILACRLREQGVQVAMYDTSVTPASYILAAAFRFSHVVLAAPTYNAGVFVTMENLLHDLTAHTLKNRRVAYIENGSWAPTSARGMQKLLEPLKWEQAADTVTLRSALRQGQQEELERMAMQLADSVNA